MKIFTFFVLIFAFFSVTLGFKPDNKKTGLTEDSETKLKHNPKVRKQCEVKEQCRRCTFEELKTTQECKQTGGKFTNYCTYFKDAMLIDEIYFTESCADYPGVSSIYVLFLICVIIAIGSFYVRRSYRSFMLQQTWEKLSIFKKK